MECKELGNVLSHLGCFDRNRIMDSDDEAFCHFGKLHLMERCPQVATVNIKNATAAVVTKSND